MTAGRLAGGIDSWSTGRVVLAGDAAHRASRYSGMGISGGLVGAYVLAGEINRSPDDLTAAPANYECVLRPFVDEIQGKVNPNLPYGVQWGTAGPA
ncbi:FAD-dependent monooxygenase [Streptomyces kroppenstedtii]|uniref:FAD-dependent monooxygenase n=1 Tax=Streptomyces kroppenstedtii TaxID=3051181 RepID=UPI0028D70755|nr:FAD-dependent monooxygenase [Streptomyces sp. DSM 40484]